MENPFSVIRPVTETQIYQYDKSKKIFGAPNDQCYKENLLTQDSTH
jgi:hypothetical protein